MMGGALHRVQALKDGVVIHENFYSAHETQTVFESLGPFVQEAQRKGVTTFELRIEPIGYHTLTKISEPAAEPVAAE